MREGGSLLPGYVSQRGEGGNERGVEMNKPSAYSEITAQLLCMLQERIQWDRGLSMSQTGKKQPLT